MAHELIKLKLMVQKKKTDLYMAEELCQQLRAEFMQMIGNTVIMYRKNEEKHK